jgi:hypothetical protein
VRVEAAKDMPSGIMNTKDTILTMIISLASAGTEMNPENNARISKAHHSKHTMQALGIPILK